VVQVTLELIREVDKFVRDRAVYTFDKPGKDQWRSYASQMLANPSYVLRGDCDDWASTVLDLLARKGVPKKQLIRAMVASPEAQKAGIDCDHFIGIVKLDNGQKWTVGDTFGPPSRLVFDQAGPHKIWQTSLVSEGTLWRGKKLKRQTNSAAMDLRISPKGLAMLKQHEGVLLRAYDDFRPRYVLKVGDVVKGTLTIGYGHTGPDVRIGQKITQLEADALLQEDLKVFERAVKKLVKIPLQQHEFDALVIFCYNCGEANLRKSTLLKKINARAPTHEIMAEFRKWNRSKGKVMIGLTERREEEARLFAGLNTVKTAAGAVRKAPPVETARGDLVEVEPTVKETESVAKSKTVMSTAMIALVSFVGEVAPHAQELMSAGELAGIEWLRMAGATVVGLCAAVMFANRILEISGAKK
jgi:lysozyme